MQILVVDPYFTYSHKVWFDGLCASSDHKFSKLTLPPFHWKWRMHGGTLQLAQQFNESYGEFEMIMATDMLDLSLFIAQCKGFLKPSAPIWLYFHENQLTYPFSELDRDKALGYDNHYAFINLTSALLADRLIFNSKFHRDSFLTAIPGFLDQFPRPKLTIPISKLFDKSHVIYPGFDSSVI
ncbi:MAG: DUF3524 domain-containing protein, partial [Saprospiraceae bacterium]|nr:DUF3524 domain-containing protein [Saprospiraceae bacterium]